MILSAFLFYDRHAVYQKEVLSMGEQAYLRNHNVNTAQMGTAVRNASARSTQILRVEYEEPDSIWKVIVVFKIFMYQRSGDTQNLG